MVNWITSWRLRIFCHYLWCIVNWIRTTQYTTHYPLTCYSKHYTCIELLLNIQNTINCLATQNAIRVLNCYSIYHTCVDLLLNTLHIDLLLNTLYVYWIAAQHTLHCKLTCYSTHYNCVQLLLNSQYTAHWLATQNTILVSISSLYWCSE